MARVVDCYTATMTSRWYIFADPYTMDDKVQQEAGTSLILPADYAERMTNDRYPVSSPSVSGWLNWTYIGDITPVYKTVTDVCTPPTSVILSGKTLTIAGGAGGDLNTFQGYQVSWRDANIGTTSYGSWSSDVTVSSSNTTVTYNVTAPSGKVRQFRVRTLGSAGSSYYSSYVTCSTTLTGNTAPSRPAIKLPATNAITINKSPVIVVSCTADVDGDTMTLKRQIDNGSWTSVKNVTSGTVYDQLPTLSTGSHTVVYKLADAYEESGTVSVVFTVNDQKWSRTISTGSVISNQNISHVADINELLSAVNIIRKFYGFDNATLTGTVGRFGDWKIQMEAMVNALSACMTATGRASYSLTVPSYPTASTFNAIRNYTLQT